MATDASEISGGLREAIRHHAGWALAVGVLMVIVGFVAIGSPFVTGVAVTISVGVMLLIGGVGQCVLAFRAGAFGRGLLIFLLGVVSIVAGIFLLSQPVAGLASITLLLAAYFLASGVLAVVAAFHLRPAQGWGFMLANGVVTLLLGLLIWRQWPVSGIWAVGVLFGIHLIVGGASLAAIASAVRNATRTVV
jgi:uncharacterized membrane protein HdeD (DUF308 family)